MTGKYLMFRDLQVAEDIGERARLGYFDKEFYFYGTTYYRNNQQYYLISANADRIYDFLQEMILEDIYCAPVEKYVYKCQVPSGTEEYIAHDIKVLLGRQMQRKYNEEFLKEFQSIFVSQTSNIADDYLQQLQHKIDGLFDEEQLYIFELLLQQAYRSKVLKKENYEKYCNWIKEVKADMGENIIVKDIYKRDLYNISYIDGNRRKYVINAQKAKLYEKQEALYQNNILSTDVYKKTYWYNHEYKLSDARKDYELYLSSSHMREYYELSETINHMKSGIDVLFFEEMYNALLEKYGLEVDRYLKFYKNQWNC